MCYDKRDKVLLINLESNKKYNIGQTIRNNDDSEGLNTLKEQGNKLRVKISELEEKKRSIDKIFRELL